MSYCLADWRRENIVDQVYVGYFMISAFQVGGSSRRKALSKLRELIIAVISSGNNTYHLLQQYEDIHMSHRVFSVVVFYALDKGFFHIKMGRFCFVTVILREFRGTQLVEVLHYKAKELGSIPNGVITIFALLNPFYRTMALESAHPLT